MSISDRIRPLIEGFFLTVGKSIDDVTLEKLETQKNPFIKAMFKTKYEYILFFLNEKAERAVVTKFGTVMEKIAAEFIKENNGEILKIGTDAKPFDLKFRIRNQEIWMEMKSILEQNKSNNETIRKNKIEAENNNVKFILGIYYQTKMKANEDHVLYGDEFWKFIGGKESKNIVIKIMEDVGNNYSIKDMVEKKAEILLGQSSI